MGVYVSDGILLGVIIKPERLTKDADLEQAFEQIENILKITKEEAEPVANTLDPYSGNSDIAVGVFWEWSTREAMELDNQYKQLYKVQTLAEQTVKKEKYQRLKELLIGTLQKVVADYNSDEITFYEMRRYS